MNEANDRRETELDRWRDLVTQVDWGSQVMQESWYGHRHPCRRLALWVHLSAFVGCLTLTFHAFSSWPILHPYLTPNELKVIQDSHAACFDSLCRAVESITFTCEMMPDSQVVILDDPLPAGRIELPQECHRAIEITFGKDSEHELLASARNAESDPSTRKQLDLLHFGNVTEDVTNIPIFQIQPEECLAYERLLEHLVLGDMFWGPTTLSFMIDLVDTFKMNPGDRQTVHLRTYVCPQSMSQHMKKEIIPQSKQVYKSFMKWRRTSTVALLYFCHMVYYSVNSATNMFFLLIPASVLWCFLPKAEIRGQRITLFHTLTTLLLLTALTEEGTASRLETIRTGILIASALSFDNSKAAVEWGFLYFLSFMEVDRIEWGVPNDWLVALGPSFQVIQWASTIFPVLIPGDGLWKLVSLYVLYMAFPRRASRQQGAGEAGENHEKQD
jgi:hypothetical protein